MKKIFLTCAVVAMTIFATEAQTKKNTGKKKAKTTVSSDAKLKADIARIKQEKKVTLEEQRIAALSADSTRKEDERIAELQKDSARIAWKEQKLREVDSSNQTNWKKTAEEKEMSYATERSQNQINKAAKLSDNEGRQVKAINIAYNEKAQSIVQDMAVTEDQRKQQLTALNEERRSKIRAVVGKGKEKSLEKERIKYGSKNADDKQSAWLNQATVNNK
jgi:hypothetical protein